MIASAVLRLVVLDGSDQLDEVDMIVVDDRIDQLVQLVLDDDAAEPSDDRRVLGSWHEGVIDGEKLHVLVVEEPNDLGEKSCCGHALRALVLLRQRCVAEQRCLIECFHVVTLFFRGWLCLMNHDTTMRS